MAARPRTVWKRPGPLGQAQALASLEGVVSPLLAGFSLTTITLLLTIESSIRPPLADWAVAAFAIAAGLFVYAIQFSAAGMGYAVAPGDRLSWTPEATIDESELQRARRLQAVDAVLFDEYSGRANYCYEYGLIAFLAGLLLLLVPAHWTVLRGIPVIVVGAALALEIAWSRIRHLDRTNTLRRILLPSRPNVTLKVEQEPDVLDPSWLGALVTRAADGTHAPQAAPQPAEQATTGEKEKTR